MLVSSIGYLHKNVNVTKGSADHNKVQSMNVTNRGLSENNRIKSTVLWNKFLNLFVSNKKTDSCVNLIA